MGSSPARGGMYSTARLDLPPHSSSPDTVVQRGSRSHRAARRYCAARRSRSIMRRQGSPSAKILEASLVQMATYLGQMMRPFSRRFICPHFCYGSQLTKRVLLPHRENLGVSRFLEAPRIKRLVSPAPLFSLTHLRHYHDCWTL